jgi:hypothetical protein
MIRIPAVQFTYDIWRAGSLTELGIPHRTWAIKLYRKEIKQMAVGFTEGYKLHVRPKIGYMAIMFFTDNKHFWTHLTVEEFNIVNTL